MTVAARTGAAIAITKPAKNDLNIFMGELLWRECVHSPKFCVKHNFQRFLDRLPRASPGLFSATTSRSGEHTEGVKGQRAQTKKQFMSWRRARGKEDGGDQTAEEQLAARQSRCAPVQPVGS